jgi:hypothetical protein
MPGFQIGDFGNLCCVPLPAFFSQTPTGHSRFVDNKHQTPIRPPDDRSVDALFLSLFGLESCCFSLAFVSSVTGL